LVRVLYRLQNENCCKQSFDRSVDIIST